MSDDRVQHYRMVRRLGAGGMGEIYLADDPRLGRRLAIKLLPTEFAQDTSRRARFLTEARAAAALNHPNICTVYDAGETAGGRLFIALELLEGDTLDVRLKTGPLEVAEVVRIGMQLASAMEAAHAKGILHRDLKPANLHLDVRGHLKVLDFGLAKRLIPEPGSAEASTQWQTRTGGILGTPQYMSPEQALGKALDPRSDLFSCGAVLYELLTGRSPFGGPTFAELVEQIVHRPPEAIARFNYAVPPELERVVLKCLQKDPDQRYQSARELAVDLRAAEAQSRSEAVGEQPGPAQVVTWVLVGTNAEELEQTVGVQETAGVLKSFQEAMSLGLRKFSQARQEASLGSTMLLSFPRPSNAVQWALELVAGPNAPLQCRAGLHLGEVTSVTPESEERYGGQLTVCERLLQLARPGQVLMGRAVFDSARQVLKGEDIRGVGPLKWVGHGLYTLKGVHDPVEVCEVAQASQGGFEPPRTSENAHRHTLPHEEPVLGWRPAIGQEIPNSRWILERKLGEGGFGEVWVAQHQKLKQRHVFKFCFRADRVRALKREMTLFKVFKGQVGEHPHIVKLHDVYLDEPPFYLEEEYVEGRDLATWCGEQGGVANIDLETKLEIVAQAAAALQAAHDSGVIHRDVKPGNILIGGEQREAPNRPANSGPPEQGQTVTPPSSSATTQVKLTDFGIGQVVSEAALIDVTRTGFTETLLADSSSSKTGTFIYMAPELLAGKPASTRSDIYSLGVVLYQLLIADFKSPLTADWSDRIRDPLLREDLRLCFAGNPENRFAGAGQLAHQLRDHRGRQARQASRERSLQQARRWRAIGSVTALFGGVAALVAGALLYGLLEAKRQKGEAVDQRDRALQLSYVSDIQLAQSTLEMGDFGRARTLLDRHVPLPGEPDRRGWEWRFLRSQLLPDHLRTIGHHQSELITVAFLDEQRLVTASAQDRRIALWDFASGALLDKVIADGDLSDVAVHPDGDYVAACVGTTNLYLYATQPLRLHTTLTSESAKTRVTFSPDGRHLAAIGWHALEGHQVLLWDVSQRPFPTHPIWRARVDSSCVAFSPVGGYLAYPTPDPDHGNLELFALDPGEVLRRVQWRTARAQEALHLVHLAFSVDGSLLALADMEGQLRLVDVDGGEVQILKQYSQALQYVAFSPDGAWLATAGRDAAIRVWDLREREEHLTFLGHGDWINAITFSPDSRFLVTAGKDQTCRVWDLTVKPRRETLVQQVPTDGAGVGSADGRFLLCLENWNIEPGRDWFESAQLWDLRAFAQVRQISIPTEGLGEVIRQQGKSCMPTVKPDGTQAIFGLNHGLLVSWDLQNGNLGLFATTGTNLARYLVFSRDGRLLAAARQDGAITVYDAESRAPICGYQADTLAGPLWNPQMTFDTAGHRLIILHHGNLAALEIEPGSMAEKVERPPADPDGMAESYVYISPDGTTLATKRRGEHQVILCNAASLQPLHSLSSDAGYAQYPVFGRGDRIFYFDQSRIAVADTVTGRVLAALDTGSQSAYRMSGDAESGTLAVVHSVVGQRRYTIWRVPSVAEITEADSIPPTKSLLNPE